MYAFIRAVSSENLCICENKGTDQLRGYCTADQRLCCCYLDSTIPLLPKSKLSSLKVVQPSLSWPGPVGKRKDMFSCVAAHDLKYLFLSAFSLNDYLIAILKRQWRFMYLYPRKLCLWEGILFLRCPNIRTTVCP